MSDQQEPENTLSDSDMVKGADLRSVGPGENPAEDDGQTPMPPPDHEPPASETDGVSVTDSVTDVVTEAEHVVEELAHAVEAYAEAAGELTETEVSATLAACEKILTVNDTGKPI